MLARNEPGFDGAEIFVRETPIPGTSRNDSQTYRGRPGTFTWLYARGTKQVDNALFLGGSRVARVYERAGLDAPGTVDWTKAGSSQWKGLPPARLIALEEWKQLTQDLGKLVTSRLILYVVEGKTTDEIGKRFDIGRRAAAFVLREDLKAAAVYFGYIGRRVLSELGQASTNGE